MNDQQWTNNINREIDLITLFIILIFALSLYNVFLNKQRNEIALRLFDENKRLITTEGKNNDKKLM